MRILGIDPGLNITGFAVLDSTDSKKELVTFGVIRTSPKTEKSTRLKEIYDDLKSILARSKPDICSIEQIFFSKNVSTAIAVSEARGVAILALNESGLPFHEYTPSAMKKALTGNGRADKKSIQKMVMLELKLKEMPKPDDAADALSLALALAAELRYHRHLKQFVEK
ncbi:crossover junction endodeoxyribonuclease RuvC [Candidatus Peregrinibacteria bacterium]|nr:crossover junction endodeoxyribonuclease RuvC [Candidatus Peregrinibacteria bacterium]